MGKWLIPCVNRVLVEKIVPPNITARIFLPLLTSKPLTFGKVVAVGPGFRDRNGNLIPVAFKEGETVLLPEFGISKIKFHDGKEYNLYWDDDILGALHD